MYDIFHQWIMDAFKLLYFNSRLWIHAFSSFLQWHEFLTLSIWQGNNFEVLPVSRLQIWSNPITLPCPEDRPSLYVAEILRMDFEWYVQHIFSISNVYNRMNVANFFFRQRVAFILSPSARHSGIGFLDFCLQKASGGMLSLHYLPFSNHASQILEIFLNLGWSHVTTFLLLTHACLIIPNGDPWTHSTKFGGLPRLPLLLRHGCS